MLARAGPSAVILYPVPGSSWAEVAYTLEVLGEAYSALGIPGRIPEVWVYPSQAMLEAHVAEASIRLGASLAAAYEAAVYEALEDKPRLHVCARCLASIPEGRALLAHEAGHSILHPSVEYYMVRLEPGLEPWRLHAAATAVKDLEVNSALAARGLEWALRGLKSYWTPRIPQHCRGPLEVADTLRAATAWIALNEDPPVCPEVSRAVKALRALLTLEGRPWAHVLLVARSL